MTQEQLNSLAITATENDVLQNIDFQNDFTTTKLRKKNFKGNYFYLLIVNEVYGTER